MPIDDVENSKHHATLSADSWEQDIRTKVNEKHLSIESFMTRIDRCFLLSIESRKDYISFCRSFLTLYLLKPSSMDSEKARDSLYPLIEKLLSFGEVDWQLGLTYKAFLLTLLGYQVDEVHFTHSKQGVFYRDHGGVLASNHIPSIVEGAECLLLLGAICVLRNDKALLHQVLLASQWHLKLFDEQGSFPKSLWTRENEFSLESFYYLHAILFKFSTQVSSLPEFSNALYSIKLKMNSIEQDKVSYFYELFEDYIEGLLQGKSVHCNLEAMDPESNKVATLGYGAYSYNDVSLKCTVSGAGTSFASYRKSSIEVVSVGPHYHPLGQMQNFGIYRTPLLKERCFRDVEIKNEPDSFFFSGFSKTVDPKSNVLSPGNTWLHISCSAKKETVTFDLERVDLETAEDLNIVLFVKADKAIVDNMYHLSPSSLNRYEGKACDTLFKSGEDILSLSSSAKGDMQIIPLAGKDHFWGATFLLALPIHPKEILNVCLK
ncbi:MAG: hypothetical protein S4CHLAM37_10830 [Chlamydiia bacterium]|nr:hypothetical protein [Chlamydiia bacterium]